MVVRNTYTQNSVVLPAESAGSQMPRFQRNEGGVVAGQAVNGMNPIPLDAGAEVVGINPPPAGRTGCQFSGLKARAGQIHD